MKRNTLKLGLVVFVAVFVALLATTAFSELVTNVPSDLSADELEAIVVEDFEKSPEWDVITTPKKWTKNDDEDKNPVPTLEIKVIDGSPNDMQEEDWQYDDKGTKKTKILGVNFKFKYPGHNSVHLLPKEPIGLPGRAQGISMWVHGRGNDYDLEAWIEDYNGDVHILKMGSVNFVGWRPLKVDIPANVPQSIDSYPQTKILKIQRFVLRADPSEIVRNTFFFFDQIKVLTQRYEVNFDGQGLEDAFESSKDKEGSTVNGGSSGTTTQPTNNTAQ